MLFLAVGLIGTALATPLFTRFSAFVREKNAEGFFTTLSLGIRSLLLVGLPLGVLLATFSEPLIGLIFEHGEFDARGTELASRALWGHAPGMALAAMSTLVSSAALAYGRKWSVVGVMVTMVALNAYLDWVLSQQMQLFGIAISTTIVSGIRVFLLICLLMPKLLIDRELMICLIRTVILSVLLAIPGLIELFGDFGFQNQLWWRITILCIAAVWAGVVFLFTWKRFLRVEWMQLTKLRKSAATHVQKL